LTRMIGKPASYAFVKMENIKFFTASLLGIRNTVTENQDLKKENLFLLSQLAELNDLKDENNFLRKALDIPSRFNRKVVYANIYSYHLGFNGYDVLLNKGTDDEISEGDVVTTEEGLLVGRVDKAHDDFSRILVVNDINFSVTARILNSDTAGIARGSLNQGLYLDLITQSDQVKEGDILVSSGLDLFPPALIIGIVSHVEINETDLFKKVKVRPAIEDFKAGKVLVIRKKQDVD